MSKKDMFGKMVEPFILLPFQEVYGYSAMKPTEKQRIFITQIVDGLYELLGDKLTVKEIQEKIGEESG